MSQENQSEDRRERFETVLALLNARDFDSLGPFLDGEVEFQSVLAGAEGEMGYTGIDGLRRWAENVDSIWDDWHQEVVDFHEVSDDKAVAVVRATGRAKASGVPLDTRTGNVLTWERGGFRLAAYSDPHEALEAAGLSE